MTEGAVPEAILDGDTEPNEFSHESTTAEYQILGEDWALGYTSGRLSRDWELRQALREALLSVNFQPEEVEPLIDKIWRRAPMVK